MASVFREDVLLDSNVYIEDTDYRYYIYGNLTSLTELGITADTLTYGRMPEDNHEVVIKLPDEYYIFRDDSDEAINEIADACRLMSAQKTGALIVLANVSNLNEIVETGDAIDARIESRLIQNLFFKNSPLHDGALIIRNNRLVAARCTLPNTQKVNLPPEYGMRHKAAIGITEETDAVVVVVSEETGRISYVRAGEIQTMENAMALKVVLEKANIGHIEQ